MSKLTVHLNQMTLPAGSSIGAGVMPLLPVTLFLDGAGEWRATSNPSDSVGYTTGLLILDGDGDVAIDTTVLSGFRTLLASSDLLAY